MIICCCIYPQFRRGRGSRGYGFARLRLENMERLSLFYVGLKPSPPFVPIHCRGICTIGMVPPDRGGDSLYTYYSTVSGCSISALVIFCIIISALNCPMWLFFWTLISFIEIFRSDSMSAASLLSSLGPLWMARAY